MPIDPEVESAIHKVVSEMNQPDKVAKRLVLWLKAMSEGDLQLDRDLEHLDALKKAIVVEGDR